MLTNTITNFFVRLSVVKYEPDNATAKDFLPLIMHRLQLDDEGMLTIRKLYLLII